MIHGRVKNESTRREIEEENAQGRARKKERRQEGKISNETKIDRRRHEHWDRTKGEGKVKEGRILIGQGDMREVD
jgi:hypothetical protein